MVYSVTHDINPTKAFFTVQNVLRKSKVLDDITCKTLYRILKKNRNTMCKIRTEIKLHPLVKHDVQGIFFLQNTRHWVHSSWHALQELLSNITKNVQITGKISTASLRFARCLLRRFSALQSALIRHTVQPFTESDDSRCCDNKICPP